MASHRRTLRGRHDLLVPAAAFTQRYPCLLESVAHGNALARFDILFAFPQDSLTLHADNRVRDGSGNESGERFLDALDAAWRAERTPAEDDDLPFHGGWVLLLAYELAAQIEPTLKLPTSTKLPLALAIRCPAAVIVDHANGCTILLAEAGREDLLDLMEADLAVTGSINALPAVVAWNEDPPQQFIDGVERIHEYLRAGDVFQVNLSRAWQAHYETPPTPAALHAVLRKANPAPFAGLLQQPGWAVVSSSPERLVDVRRGVVQARPIAGTRPRTDGEDELERIRELVAHPKERAEHVMLIDLVRNDLGRICVPGSVEVDELMVVESYTHVHHIVSNVRGRLRDDVTPGQTIAAVFPGGTITGCPKVRCMQIIAELEDTPRGAYTGALGYLDRSGELDLNILIRTLSLTGREVSLRAGAGIVVDSIADAELEETRAKARGLLRALGVPD